MKQKAIIIGIVSLIILLLAGVLLYSHYFGPVDRFAGQAPFIVTQDETSDQVDAALKSAGFIRSRTAFRIASVKDMKGKSIKPGGYEISASMDVWSIASAFSKPPYLVFFTFPPGWRKEQIADKLTSTFSWTPAQKKEWLTVDTAPSASFVEGVYFPDTYLIPSDQTQLQIAQRFTNRFQEVFATTANEATQKNIPWTEVVILASMLEREAASTKDMPLIAGIMLNRLRDHMPLQIDATLQYIKGTDTNWWPVPTSGDKSLDSAFNTYKHVGLPPHAISNPGLASMQAVLNATVTNCIYYLHDPSGQIHCSANYRGQLANVNKYLK